MATPPKWRQPFWKRVRTARPMSTTRRTPGALGAIEAAGLFAPLPAETLDIVDPRFPFGATVNGSGSPAVPACSSTTPMS